MKNVYSGTKYRWLLPTIDDATVLHIASRYNLSLPIAQVLASRGITDPSALDSYLFGTLDPESTHAGILKDAHKAAERIMQAITNQEKILICGDYDVDGITSSALMLICLLPLGAQVNFFLPHRTRDGYGLSTKTVERAARNGYRVIVTVDNGITAFEPARVARDLGIDLIITDHHRQHEQLPEAYAIVNPNQAICPYPFKALAGVGVSFKVMELLYHKQGLTLPPKVYELLLLGTIADVVPLIGENRFWVRHGLHHINKIESHALRILKQNGKLSKPKISSLDIGFSLTPQINALGRLEDARQGVQFLIGDDAQTVEDVGKVLYELNEARKVIERSIFNQIEQEITKGSINVTDEMIIMAASASWPSGVIGLVASRLVSAFTRPTLLFHITNDGVAKGSCRSLGNFNIFDALQQSGDIINQFGGHSMAAGLSLPAARLPELKKRLEEHAKATILSDDLHKKLTIDAFLPLSDITAKLIHDLEYLEPFGHGNPQPTFCMQNVSLIDEPILLKDAHVKCRVFADGIIKPVIFFNNPELYPILQRFINRPFTLAAQVMENHWQGRTTIELCGLDIAGEP